MKAKNNAQIQKKIIPIFIVIMIENSPKVNWGELIVPVLSD